MPKIVLFDGNNQFYKYVQTYSILPPLAWNVQVEDSVRQFYRSMDNLHGCYIYYEKPSSTKKDESPKPETI